MTACMHDSLSACGWQTRTLRRGPWCVCSDGAASSALLRTAPCRRRCCCLPAVKAHVRALSQDRRAPQMRPAKWLQSVSYPGTPYSPLSLSGQWSPRSHERSHQSGTATSTGRPDASKAKWQRWVAQTRQQLSRFALLARAALVHISAWRQPHSSVAWEQESSP